MKPTGLPKKQRPPNIVNVTHDPITKDLHVTFHNGQTYVYSDVHPITYSNMLKAPSLGQFFHAHVKTKHAYHKVNKK